MKYDETKTSSDLMASFNKLKITVHAYGKTKEQTVLVKMDTHE